MSNEKKYQYPFKIYVKMGEHIQPNHIFGEYGTWYTEKEICNLLFQHGMLEFAGNVTFTYDEQDEMLIPNFKSQKHG